MEMPIQPSLSSESQRAPTHQDVKGSLSTVSVLSRRQHTPRVAEQEHDETANYGEACTAGKEQPSDGWLGRLTEETLHSLC